MRYVLEGGAPQGDLFAVLEWISAAHPNLMLVPPSSSLFCFMCEQWACGSGESSTWQCIYSDIRLSRQVNITLFVLTRGSLLRRVLHSSVRCISLVQMTWKGCGTISPKYENTIEFNISHTSAHTFLNNIFQNFNSHVSCFYERWDLWQRGVYLSSDAYRKLEKFTFQAQVRGSNVNTSLIMCVRKPARKQESHCIRSQR